MPKTPNGKKRKLSSKKQKGCKPKRLKFDDKQDLENAGAAHVSEKESEREAGSSNGDIISERDIDEILEENASRNNLTAMNVKSIIHVSNLIKYMWLALPHNLSYIFKGNVTAVFVTQAIKG